MEMTVKIDYAKFAEAFNALPIMAARELKKEMVASAKTVVRDAKAHHRFDRKSGMLQRSIREEVDKSGLYAKVFLDEGIASYGKYVHEGTRPHRIVAKDKKALSFMKGGITYMVPKVPHKVPGWMVKSGIVGNSGNGKTVWSQKGYVDHPGTKPDRFLYNAAVRQKPYFIERINGAVKRIIEAAGF